MYFLSIWYKIIREIRKKASTEVIVHKKRYLVINVQNHIIVPQDLLQNWHVLQVPGQLTLTIEHLSQQLVRIVHKELIDPIC